MRLPLGWIVVLLLLFAAAGVAAGIVFDDESPNARIIGWGIGLAFACLAAFAASRWFAGQDD